MCKFRPKVMWIPEDQEHIYPCFLTPLGRFSSNSPHISLPELPSHPRPSHLSRSSQSARLDSLCYAAAPRQPAILQGSVHVSATVSIPPTLSVLRCAHESAPHVCVSIPALKIG